MEEENGLGANHSRQNFIALILEEEKDALSLAAPSLFFHSLVSLYITASLSQLLSQITHLHYII